MIRSPVLLLYRLKTTENPVPPFARHLLIYFFCFILDEMKTEKISKARMDEFFFCSRFSVLAIFIFILEDDHLPS